MKSFLFDSYGLWYWLLGLGFVFLAGLWWYFNHRLSSLKRHIDILNRVWNENFTAGQHPQEEFQYLVKMVLDRIDQLDCHLNERFDRIEQKLEQIDMKLSSYQVLPSEEEEDFLEEDLPAENKELMDDRQKPRFRGEDGIFPFGLS
ncbi:hypothetical protein EM20IM_03745 [Candidatus Methylacidiphilum infernorum]|uniref:Uncharacterized protein n=1 Tax=Candidatus Methylacidiphilum infernorum TaxID=511746 RepID=A0ABX7PWQ3_9BACT|nr:hypothetical protein [Candidatus Methylacidiphilum infernorum]QSR87450.1 hypothetical protein EM20IM_03745 [Candidatus Methylacidiphilum infernorum]